MNQVFKVHEDESKILVELPKYLHLWLEIYDQ